MKFGSSGTTAARRETHRAERRRRPGLPSTQATIGNPPVRHNGQLFFAAQRREAAIPGSGERQGGLSHWAILPSRSTATRSAVDSASSWSWVTSTPVVPVSASSRLARSEIALGRAGNVT
jgi:hypothetical protein